MVLASHALFMNYPGGWALAGIVAVSIPFESYVKRTSMRRADNSGQYVVEIEETSTVTDGTETNGKTI